MTHLHRRAAIADRFAPALIPRLCNALKNPSPTRFPSDEPPPHPAEPLQICTPVIRLHGKIEPTIDDDDLRAFAQEDENALVAIEEFEKMLRNQSPS